MLGIIIKNNFKLMFRNKLLVVMMTLCPVIVVAALTNAFAGLLSNGYQNENFVLGYHITDDSNYIFCKEQMLDVFREQDVDCIEFTQGDPKDIMQKGLADVFLLADNSGCTLYSTNPEQMNTRICRYVVKQFELEMQIQLEQSVDAKGKVNLKIFSLPWTKTAESSDYYGIIEMVYFLFCSAIFLATVVQSERANRIQSRFCVAPVSKLTLYLGKFVPCEIISVVCISISALLSTALYHIQWGNIWGTIGIIFLLSIATTAFGIVCVYIMKNLAASIVILFVVVWVAGFLGGSFETYMYSSVPDYLKELSPIYYVNRTLVEYSTMGQSDYTGRCIVVLLIMSLICLVAGSLLMNRRLEEK